MSEQPSGRLYSAVTKHWPRIATVLVIIIGLVEFVVGGITADSGRPGSQRLPRGLPIRLGRDRGDFLAVLGNRRSRKLVDSLMRCATSYVPELQVLGLKIWCGLENRVHHLRHSDHAPFWKAGKPALMWTDTAEFRNPNYHQPTDTPDTLDYEFLRSVTHLLIAHTIRAVGASS